MKQLCILLLLFFATGFSLFAQPAKLDNADPSSRLGLQKIRQQAVSLAISAHKISFPKDFKIGVDLFSRSDWSLNSQGKAVLGNSAFQSPAWLAAALAALQFQTEHSANWPFTQQDYHLCMALTYGQILSRAKELGLSADEISDVLNLSTPHEQALDPAHEEAFKKGEWPSSPPMKSIVADNIKFYTLPAIRANDSVTTVSLNSDEGPLRDVPIVISQEYEAGLKIISVTKTDADGIAFLRIPASLSGQTSFLVSPFARESLFAHRIAFLRPEKENDSTSIAPPGLSIAPNAVESGQEEIFQGEHLLSRNAKTALTLGPRDLPLLASSPSFILTRIPDMMPGTWTLGLSAIGGNLSTDLRVAAIQADLQNKLPHPGEQTELTLTETGAPSLSLWVWLEQPFLLFQDGTRQKIVTLEEHKPASLELQAKAPGKFRITFGIAEENRETAFAELEEMKNSLRNEEEIKVVDSTEWALSQNEFEEAEGLLEKLRYQALLREKIDLKKEVETILLLMNFL